MLLLSTVILVNKGIQLGMQSRGEVDQRLVQKMSPKLWNIVTNFLITGKTCKKVNTRPPNPEKLPRGAKM